MMTRIKNGPSVSEMFARTPPEQLAAGMAAWQAWREKNYRVHVSSGSVFLQAASMEEADGLIKDHPHLRMPGSSVEILECVAMPGVP